MGADALERAELDGDVAEPDDATSFAERLGGPAGFALIASAALVSLLLGSGPDAPLGAGLGGVMMLIALIDRHSFIIPNKLVVLAAALGLVGCALTARGDLVDLAIAAARGVIAALAFAAVLFGYRWFRGFDGMGLGDVKLAVVAGIWLDWLALACAIELAALAALVVVGVRVARGLPFTRGTAIPFGMYFAPAIWICWLVQTGLPDMF